MAALTPSKAALGIDAFERGTPVIAKILAYLVREMNLVESEREKSMEFVDTMCQITLEVFWTEHSREDR